MKPSFDSLGVSPDLVQALAPITTPFPIQALTIPDALAGRDVCGKARTGSGKTLAFGLPMLQRLAAGDGQSANGRPRGLVMVPTRELCRQVADVLRPLGESLGLKLATVYGGTGMDTQIKAIRRPVDVVVATPGRLIDLHQRGELHFDAVEILVLDEADRMADMGFLPPVEWVLRRLTHAHQTMLFSATLDGEVDYLINHYLTDPVRHDVVEASGTIDGMEHRFLAVHQLDKVKVAAAIARASTRTLLFTRTKRGADQLTRNLQREGVKADAIHGDLPQRLRERALADFGSGKLPVLVATDVAARGIHVEGIDVVIHYDPPEDNKAYLHRSGRTARAGEEGLVVTLVLWDQRLEVERLQKRTGIRQPVIEVFSNDRRLQDLRNLGRPAGEAAGAALAQA
ncbi:MAG TPA: DEAD/DEAH box helicase [Acidimicrobiales bacterium]|nr:DEAD/DEAH box helicase [Acidimicrobiales bacterium]